LKLISVKENDKDEKSEEALTIIIGYLCLKNKEKKIVDDNKKLKEKINTESVK
jgi:hypothetical protein